MSSLRTRAARLVRRAQSARALPRARVTARRLVSAGLVDREWIELQAGLEFADDEEAARWYAGPGRTGGASPHPLVEPEWIAPTTWRSDRVEPALRAVDRAAPVSAHPLLPTPGSLAALLPGPSPEQRLDAGPSGSVTYAEWHRTIVAAQAVESGHRALKQIRTQTQWDAAADADYVRRWSSAPLPVVDGPLVSVVMPVRNRPVVVVDAIRSAQAQSLTDFELIVVDDGSDDSTPDVLDSLAAADPRIRVLRRAQGGVCAARNAGIAEATAPYLAFLDSDNEWTPDFLRVAVAAMSADTIDVAFAVVEEISERGRRYRTFEGGAAHLQMGNFVDLNVLVSRTEVVRAVGGFDPTLRRMVDYDLVWKLADRGPLRLLPFVGVRYSAHSDIADRITTTESLAWDDVVKCRRMIDWAGLREGAGSRRADLVSVVVPCRATREAAVSTVRSVLASTTGFDLEVVVVENASTPATWRLLWAEVGLDPRVTLLRAPVNLHRAASTSYALDATSGSVVVVVSAGTTLAPDALELLVAPVRSGDATASVDTSAPDVIAVEARALVDAGGLDPLFTNEFEAADLVLRLGPDASVSIAAIGAVVESEYERPSPGQHAANVREWERRHGSVPQPDSRVAP